MSSALARAVVRPQLPEAAVLCAGPRRRCGPEAGVGVLFVAGVHLREAHQPLRGHPDRHRAGHQRGAAVSGGHRMSMPFPGAAREVRAGRRPANRPDRPRRGLSPTSATGAGVLATCLPPALRSARLPSQLSHPLRARRYQVARPVSSVRAQARASARASTDLEETDRAQARSAEHGRVEAALGSRVACTIRTPGSCGLGRGIMTRRWEGGRRRIHCASSRRTARTCICTSTAIRSISAILVACMAMMAAAKAARGRSNRRSRETTVGR